MLITTETRSTIQANTRLAEVAGTQGFSAETLHMCSLDGECPVGHCGPGRWVCRADYGEVYGPVTVTIERGDAGYLTQN